MFWKPLVIEIKKLSFTLVLLYFIMKWRQEKKSTTFDTKYSARINNFTEVLRLKLTKIQQNQYVTKLIIVLK